MRSSVIHGGCECKGVRLVVSELASFPASRVKKQLHSQRFLRLFESLPIRIPNHDFPWNRGFLLVFPLFPDGWTGLDWL